MFGFPAGRGRGRKQPDQPPPQPTIASRPSFTPTSPLSLDLSWSSQTSQTSPRLLPLRPQLGELILSPFSLLQKQVPIHPSALSTPVQSPNQSFNNQFTPLCDDPAVHEKNVSITGDHIQIFKNFNTSVPSHLTDSLNYSRSAIPTFTNTSSSHTLMSGDQPARRVTRLLSKNNEIEHPPPLNFSRTSNRAQAVRNQSRGRSGSFDDNRELKNESDLESDSHISPNGSLTGFARVSRTDNRNIINR